MPKSRTRRASMTMWSGILRSNRIELPMVQRESRRERAHLVPHAGNRLCTRDVEKHLGDERADLAHFRFLEAARRDGGRAQADAAGVERRVAVERNGVRVDRDPRAVERLLGLLAARAFREDID